MRLHLKILAALVIVLGMSFQAQALPITLTPSSTSLVLSGNDTANNLIVAAVAAYMAGLGYTPTVELYKQNQVDPGDSGPASSSYDTTYAAGPPATATISYVGGGWIHSTPVFALIKDGNYGAQNPPGFSWYLFDITGWNGLDAVIFSGFFGNNLSSVSHVAIYGPSTATVPDGGSMAMLLGLGLIGLAGLRRMMK